MKPGIHPEYREIVFVDVSNNFSFKTRSTMATKETIKWEDGNEYPVARPLCCCHSSDSAHVHITSKLYV